MTHLIYYFKIIKKMKCLFRIHKGGNHMLTIILAVLFTPILIILGVIFSLADGYSNNSPRRRRRRR